MNIKVFYFARLRESLQIPSEDLVLPEEVCAGSLTVVQLKNYLAQRGAAWGQLVEEKQKIRAAINHTLVDDQALIHVGDEVAFFPPVTGG